MRVSSSRDPIVPMVGRGGIHGVIHVSILVLVWSHSVLYEKKKKKNLDLESVQERVMLAIVITGEVNGALCCASVQTLLLRAVLLTYGTGTPWR